MWGANGEEGTEKARKAPLLQSDEDGLIQGGIAALTTQREQVKVLAFSYQYWGQRRTEQKAGVSLWLCVWAERFLESSRKELPLRHPLGFESTHAQCLCFPRFCFPSGITRT